MDSRLPAELRLLAKRRGLTGLVALVSDGRETVVIDWGRSAKAKNQSAALARLIEGILTVPIPVDDGPDPQAPDGPAIGEWQKLTSTRGKDAGWSAHLPGRLLAMVYPPGDDGRIQWEVGRPGPVGMPSVGGESADVEAAKRDAEAMGREMAAAELAASAEVSHAPAE